MRGRRPGTGAALVTGASGFIGRHLVGSLTGQGRRVLALCRNPRGLTGLEGPLVEVLRADLGDLRSFGGRLEETASVFHLAAARDIIGTSAEEIHRVNVEATLRLASAAAEARVERFVYVSTALVFGPPDGRRLTEGDGPASTSIKEDTYGRTKVLALEALERMAGEGLALVTLYPTVVFGPDHPHRPNRVTDYLRRLLRWGVDVTIGGGRARRDLVYVDDVVRGICLAEREGALGEGYILSGQETSHRELNRMGLSLAGLRPRLRLSIHGGAALAAAKAADRLGRKGPGVGYSTMLQRLTGQRLYSSRKAEGALGYTRTPLDKGLKKTIQFLKGEGP